MNRLIICFIVVLGTFFGTFQWRNKVHHEEVMESLGSVPNHIWAHSNFVDWTFYSEIALVMVTVLSVVWALHPYLKEEEDD